GTTPVSAIANECGIRTARPSDLGLTHVQAAAGSRRIHRAKLLLPSAARTDRREFPDPGSSAQSPGRNSGDDQAADGNRFSGGGTPAQGEAGGGDGPARPLLYTVSVIHRATGRG